MERWLFLNSEDFSDNGSIANFFAWSDTRTSTHEFGHLAGLTHEDEDGSRSLMKSGGNGGNGGNLTSENLRSVLLRRKSLNKGNNFIINPFTGKKSPNTTLVDPYSGKQYNINLFGITLKYKKVK